MPETVIEYGCGHTSDGLLILEDTPPLRSAYLRWHDSVGYGGDRSQCFKCWYDASDKEMKGEVH